MPVARPVAKHAPTPKTGPRKAAGPKEQIRTSPQKGALQTKLDVGPAGDHYEREADRVARQVVGGGDTPVAIPPTITPLGAQRKAMPKPAKPDEKQKVQKKKLASPAPKAEEDKKPKAKAQRKAAGPAPKVEEDKKPKAKTQRKETGNAGGAAPGGVSDSIARMQSGSGGGLDSGTRGLMESRFGRDFGGVRLHHGPEAASAARGLNARAFTVGRDVFFGGGQYQPHSQAGRELIAHELTHTVQQAGAPGVAARKMVQKAPTPGPAAPAKIPDEKDKAAPTSTTFTSTALEGASLDTTPVGDTRGTVTLPVLALPTIGKTLKGTAGGDATPVAAKGHALPAKGAPFTLGSVAERDGSSKAYEVWEEHARKGKMKTGTRKKLGALVNTKPAPPPIGKAGQAIYYLTFKSDRVEDRKNIFIGTLEELAGNSGLLRPQWDQNGKALSGRANMLAADHVLELQLGGEDSGANMWLLQSAYNSLVGSAIKTNIDNDLKTLKKEVDDDTTIPKTKKPVDPVEMKRKWTLRFKDVQAGSKFPSGDTVPFWTQGQIESGLHIDALKVMTEADLVAAGLRLEDANAMPKVVKIFPSPAGGRMTQVELNPDGSVAAKNQFLYPNIFAEGGKYNGGTTDQEGGSLLTLDVVMFKTAKGEDKGKPIGEKHGKVEVLRSPRLGIAGYLSRDSLRSQFSSMEFAPLSPLTFADMDVSPDGALIGNGNILSSKALFPQLNVPIALYGDRIMMNFPVPGTGMNLGLIQVGEASIALGVGSEGFFIEGYAGIFVKGLGSGTITAEVSQLGPELKGVFNFDSDFFKPAFVDVNYNLATDTLKASGTLGVEKGRIPGVDSGQVAVSFTRDLIDVQGAIKLGAPLQGTEIKLAYTPDKGLVVGADNIPLPLANLPGVQNATLSVAAARSPEGVWSFAGAGKATLAVAGATGEIDITYRDGLITLHTVAQVAKGPATGTLNFTATNGALDEQGNPIDGAVGETITAWGQGTVTIAFGKIITGTAGIEYTKDNRIILRGKIALPPAYDLFAKQEYYKDLLHIAPPEFPIWGASVAGIGIGFFAFVDARVSFNAFVGPGQIRDAAVEATMDLDHPEAATIHGHGQFFVPAYAGFALNVGGGLRARAAVAYGEGRVGLVGKLGIQADASATVDFDWTPSAGVALEAKFAAAARPQFELLAEASITVGVDIKVTEVHHTFGPWQKSLGKFGPDMELGVEFPARWSEAKGLDLSLDNIVIKEPKLDAPALMKSVFERLAA